MQGDPSVNVFVEHTTSDVQFDKVGRDALQTAAHARSVTQNSRVFMSYAGSTEPVNMQSLRQVACWHRK